MITLGDWAFPIDSFSLPPGSTLLCCTDGITESRDPPARSTTPPRVPGGASGRDSRP
ncbi:SpoIIE family protein phosphatase [Streptomyces sp. NBC_01643]|uniref:SpoIIE family protein phosphatase n=1 Tax=Streptomyces sp. NBC_01643 TaxID=2975906 RepID=UPI003865ED8B